MFLQRLCWSDSNNWRTWAKKEESEEKMKEIKYGADTLQSFIKWLHDKSYHQQIKIWDPVTFDFKINDQYILTQSCNTFAEIQIPFTFILNSNLKGIEYFLTSLLGNFLVSMITFNNWNTQKATCFMLYKIVNFIKMEGN